MNKTLGIIGGGQLALMLIQSASKYGIDVICIDPNEMSPARKYASKFICADFNNLEKLKELEKLSDVILYEFENVDLNVLTKLDPSKFYQGFDVLKQSQNRLREKKLANGAGIKTVNYLEVTSKKDLYHAIDQLGYPGILKTCELGYDGHGQVRLKSSDDVMKAKELLPGSLIYEQMLDFDYEISVITVRSKNGEMYSFDAFKNVHKDGILHQTSTASVDKSINQKAIELAQNFMQKQNYTGILCLEFFVKGNEIYFNEMAPRPHNSGHITMDTYQKSQFDLCICNILGINISNNFKKEDGIMFNILGQHVDKAINFSKEHAQANLYLYGKLGAKHNRKMGHLNIQDDKELVNLIKREVFDYE